MGRLIVLLALLVVSVFAGTDPVLVVTDFEKALGTAKSWQDVRGYFNAATVKALDKLTPAQKATAWKEAQPHFKFLANPKVQQEVKGSKAVVQLRTDQGGSSNIRTYELDLENGAWKVDFSDTFDVEDE